MAIPQAGSGIWSVPRVDACVAPCLVASPYFRSSDVLSGQALPPFGLGIWL